MNDEETTTEETAPEAGDVAEQLADEQANGYVGDKVDPRPNSDYSLESGPDSPAHVPDPNTRVEQHSAAPKE